MKRLLLGSLLSCLVVGQAPCGLDIFDCLGAMWKQAGSSLRNRFGNSGNDAMFAVERTGEALVVGSVAAGVAKVARRAPLRWFSFGAGLSAAASTWLYADKKRRSKYIMDAMDACWNGKNSPTLREQK